MLSSIGRSSIAMSRSFASKTDRVRWMSVRPNAAELDGAPRTKVTLQKLRRLKQDGIPITMLTAYDFPTARQCEAHDIDVVLVGDSLAQVCLGYDSTTRLTLPEMLHHVKAVARGCKSPLLVADMPFGSYHGTIESTTQNAVKLVQEGGVESVKMEGGSEIAPIVASLTRIGIPVMAHIGLLPQRHISTSGYKVQGKSALNAHAQLEAAIKLQDAGAHAIVLEAIPSSLAAYITTKLDIPTIGIGAGRQTDGQVLVWDDAMGIWNGHKAKFVRRFAEVGDVVSDGVEGYIDAVKRREFPTESESYSMSDAEWNEFLALDGMVEVPVTFQNPVQKRIVA